MALRIGFLSLLLFAFFGLTQGPEPDRIALPGKMLRVGKPIQLTATGNCSSFKWSPSGKYLVFVWKPSEEANEGKPLPPEVSLVEWRIYDGKTSRLLTQIPEARGNWLRNWLTWGFAQEGKSLYLLVPALSKDVANLPQDAEPERFYRQVLTIVPLIGGKPQPLLELGYLARIMESPDGNYLLLSDRSDGDTLEEITHLLNLKTLQMRVVLRGPYRVIAWDVDSKSFFYRKASIPPNPFQRFDLVSGQSTEVTKEEAYKPYQTIEPVAYKDQFEVQSSPFSLQSPAKVEGLALWLHSKQSKTERYRRALLALDAEGAGSVAIAPDGHAVAYTNRHNQLYLVPLEERPPETVAEKIACGLTPTEEEWRNLYANNAKQIGLGILMYTQDYNEILPPQDNITELINPYLKNLEVFRNPGTGEIVFHYLLNGGSFADIQNPAETKLGYIETGRGYVAVIYADGHVKIERQP